MLSEYYNHDDLQGTLDGTQGASETSEFCRMNYAETFDQTEMVFSQLR